MAPNPPPTASPNPPGGQSQPEKEQLERTVAALAQVGQQIIGVFQRQRNQQPDKQDRTLSIWFLGLLPVFLACLHLMIVARGNAETLRSLVQNLNITALVLATTIPLGSSLLTW